METLGFVHGPSQVRPDGRFTIREVLRVEDLRTPEQHLGEPSPAGDPLFMRLAVLGADVLAVSDEPIPRPRHAGEVDIEHDREVVQVAAVVFRQEVADRRVDDGRCAPDHPRVDLLVECFEVLGTALLVLSDGTRDVDHVVEEPCGHNRDRVVELPPQAEDAFAAIGDVADVVEVTPRLVIVLVHVLDEKLDIPGVEVPLRLGCDAGGHEGLKDGFDSVMVSPVHFSFLSSCDERLSTRIGKSGIL